MAALIMVFVPLILVIAEFSIVSTIIGLLMIIAAGDVLLRLHRERIQKRPGRIHKITGQPIWSTTNPETGALSMVASDKWILVGGLVGLWWTHGIFWMFV